MTDAGVNGKSSFVPTSLVLVLVSKFFWLKLNLKFVGNLGPTFLGQFNSDGEIPLVEKRPFVPVFKGLLYRLSNRYKRSGTKAPLFVPVAYKPVLKGLHVGH
jgi:hypothetical protein